MVLCGTFLIRKMLQVQDLVIQNHFFVKSSQISKKETTFWAHSVQKSQVTK